jgi:hypothetical protein
MTAPPWPLPERAYHLAHAENWDSIRRTGLHSAAALIARAGLGASAARRFTAYRDRAMRLPSGEWLRDQCPMPPAALARCLDDGLAPSDWYALVNAKVFFWLDRERLDRHAAACGSAPQIVMEIDLRALVARYRALSVVTPFNVGNARRRPASRGRRTFVPLEAWLATRWLSEAASGGRPRAASHPPAELAVEGAVPDAMGFVVATRRLAP